MPVSSDMGNHLRLSPMASHEIDIGPGVPCMERKHTAKPRFLPCGLTFDMFKDKATKPSVKGSKTKVRGGSDGQRDDVEDGDDAAPPYLDPKNEERRKSLNRLGLGERDEEHRARRRKPSKPDDLMPSNPDGPTPGDTNLGIATGSGWKHVTLGLSQISVAMRLCSCALCPTKIRKGQLRYIYIPKVNESEKSIHCFCAPSIPIELVQHSVTSLHAMRPSKELQRAQVEETLNQLAKLKA